jgi:DNA replication licensing factor MCM7
MPLLKCSSQRCQDNKTGKLDLQIRGSRFMKYQELRLQELPDQVPVGHIPRSMTVHCNGEMTRQCGPGDIITVHGVFLTVSSISFLAWFLLSFLADGFCTFRSSIQDFVLLQQDYKQILI